MQQVAQDTLFELIKDGAYFCSCAYVLRISRYSGFLWVVPTNTNMFLRVLKLCGGRRTWYPKRKLGLRMHFSEIIKFQFGKKAIHCFEFYCFLELLLLNYPQKMPCYLFSFWIPVVHTKGILFPNSHKLCKNTSLLGGTALNYRATTTNSS